MTENTKFFYIGFAGKYINRQIQKVIDKKHRYGKDNFITIIQDTGKRNSDGKPLYNVGFYKQEFGLPVNGEDQIKDILEYLKEKENNIIIDGNTCKELKGV